MLTSSYPKYPGDITAPFIESIARGVAGRGHDVDLVLPQHPELDRSDEGALRFFPFDYPAPAAWPRWGYAESLEADVQLRGEAIALAPFVAAAQRAAFAERIGSRRYDVVHAHWLVPNAAFVADIAAVERMPVVISLHGSDVAIAERVAAARFFARRALEWAGFVTACSGDLRARVVALGADPARVRTVPYGVDTEFFAPQRRPLGPPFARQHQDRLLVLALGRLVEKKGFEHLVAAAAQLDDIEVVIVGDGDLRAPLQAASQRLGDGRVRLIGALDREQAAAALASADVTVVPSVIDRGGNVDGLPNVLVEAMASGSAIVASRVAGIPDVIVDGENGLLVEPGRPEAIVAALCRLRDPTLRERLGRGARQAAVSRLTWTVACAAFEECYAEARALQAH